MRSLTEHLKDQGPKRVLALDGGGVRGILTLSFLSRIEALLRERYKDSNLLLSDYFDLIGGTSTGAIIAAGLATGYSVAELQDLYRRFADEVFQKRLWRRGVLFPKYSSKRLQQVLEESFEGVDLGDEVIRTGLAIVTKRLDIACPWVITNFGSWQHDRSPSAGGNRHLSLSMLILASASAPTFFSKVTQRLSSNPEMNIRGELVDGGVTPFNNPALKLLMVATLKGYGLGWPLGPDNLLLVSVGTGLSRQRMDKKGKMQRLKESLAITDATRSFLQLLDDCNELNETVLQWFSQSDTARFIDMEGGDLQADIPEGGKLLSYERYNVKFDELSLKDFGIELRQEEANRLAEMDNPDNVEALRQVGDTAAAKIVRAKHFRSSFDLT